MYTLSDFDFTLPPELIAQVPLPERSGSRLLEVGHEVGDDHLTDRAFAEIVDLLQAGDLLVFNDTRVLKARFFGVKETGGKVEVLVERVLDARSVLAQVRASKSPPLGTLTVYARAPGAVAAPTAGLHFDTALLDRLRAKGVQFAYVTLHVGAGTFQPVRTENLAEHAMHSEWYTIAPQTVAAVAATQAAGGSVIAVGTTSLRALESASQSGVLVAGSADTRLFITPGYRFKTVDRLLTNFHLPKSTLLMLVSAFAGYARMRAAYAHAIAARYRFFSYGDAMLLNLESSP